VQIKVLISFDLSEEYIEELREDFPNIEFRVADSHSEEELIEEVRDADVVFAGRFDGKMLMVAEKLRWIHCRGAGVDRLLAIPGLAESSIILTCSRGVHPAQASDHALALILALTRKLHIFMRSQMERRWDRMLAVDELDGKTLGVIGLGSIGTEIARKAKCFGMTVIAIKKNPTSPPPFVDELLPPDCLGELLTKSDFVVISTPLTSKTRGMIGERELRIMKKKAYLINIARGGVIREEALIRALREGGIAGAGLDVFVDEPLPLKSELWDLKNVIITPHVAGETEQYLEKAIPIFYENLYRFINNQPMINIVDKKAGY